MILESLPIEVVFLEIRQILQSARDSAYRAAYSVMASVYCQSGQCIVEHEQQGQQRARYSEALIAGLAAWLPEEFGNGFSIPNLKNYHQFFKAYTISSALRSELTWTHYRLGMRVSNANTSTFYEDEAVESGWSTRVLKRERVLAELEMTKPKKTSPE